MQHGLYFTERSELISFEEEWLDGQQVDVVGTTYSANLFPGIDGITWDDSQRDDIESLRQTFGQTKRTISTEFPLGPSESPLYDEVISGQYDADFRQFAQEMVDVGIDDAYLRFNGEANRDWDDQFPDEPSDYGDAFARAVREMESVDGVNFTYTLSVAKEIGIADEPGYWPPNSSFWPSGVENPLVAPSIYDVWTEYPRSPGDSDDQNLDSKRQRVWDEAIQSRWDAWMDYAQRRNAGMASPEWGVNELYERTEAGGDNPWFMEEMFKFYDRNQDLLEYSVYWNGDIHQLYPVDEMPRASDVLKEQMRQRVGDSSGSGTDDGSDSTDSTDGDTTYGGYRQPAEGTLDWHEPLNQNFADIEADVKDLARRIRDLEN